MRFPKYLIPLAALCAALQIAHAGIIGTTGNVVESAPTSQSDAAQVYLLDSRALAIDWNLPLAFPVEGAPTRFVAAGTLVYEYAVNLSPSVEIANALASITFDRDILGIFPSQYIGPGLTELEVVDAACCANTADTVSVAPNFRTITFALNVNTERDWFSFLVAQTATNVTAIPAPAPVALITLATLAGVLRRPTNKRRSV